MHRKAEEESHIGVLWATTRTQRGAAWAAHTSSDFGCSALSMLMFRSSARAPAGKKPEARQMRVCRASTGGHTGGQGPTRANQTYLILIVCPI